MTTAARGLVLVKYNAGFDTIPQDLEQIAIELVQQSMQGYSGDAGGLIQLTPEDEERLIPYRDLPRRY